MDMLEMMVRQDRIKLLIKKKRPIWLQEEKDKEAGVGQPISFSADVDDNEMDEALFDLMCESEEEDEDDDDLSDGEPMDLTHIEFMGKAEDDEKLPCLPDDFVFKKPTPEELTEQRINNYIDTLRRMNISQFNRLCVSEGVVSDNVVFDTIGVIRPSSRSHY